MRNIIVVFIMTLIIILSNNSIPNKNANAESIYIANYNYSFFNNQKQQTYFNNNIVEGNFEQNIEINLDNYFKNLKKLESKFNYLKVLKQEVDNLTRLKNEREENYYQLYSIYIDELDSLINSTFRI